MYQIYILALTAITCSNKLSKPTNGEVSCSSNRCSFSCNDGFRLSNTDKVICVDDGNDETLEGVWSDTAPTCEGC